MEDRLDNLLWSAEMVTTCNTIVKLIRRAAQFCYLYILFKWVCELTDPWKYTYSLHSWATENISNRCVHSAVATHMLELTWAFHTQMCHAPQFSDERRRQFPKCLGTILQCHRSIHCHSVLQKSIPGKDDWSFKVYYSA